MVGFFHLPTSDKSNFFGFHDFAYFVALRFSEHLLPNRLLRSYLSLFSIFQIY